MHLNKKGVCPLYALRQMNSNVKWTKTNETKEYRFLNAKFH